VSEAPIKKLPPVAAVVTPNTIKSFQVVDAVVLPWRPSFARKLQEYKLQKGEEFEAGEHMLIVSCGKNRIGIPWSNVRYVEFA
jgi:hypothetical protein